MMKENLRRIRTLNSLHENIQPQTIYNWRDQYFTNPNQQPFMSNRQSLLQKQIDNYDPQEYDKLIRMYQIQNKEIQQRNIDLKQTVRELKDRQQNLLQEIAELQGYYRKLLKSQNQNANANTNNNKNINIKENDKQNSQNIQNYACQSQVTKYKISEDFKNQFVRTYSSNEQIQSQYKKDIDQKQNNVKNLNDQFCLLVQQSIAQKDPKRRKQLRKQLAQLAAQMKKIRGNEVTSPIQNQYGISKNSKHQKQQKLKNLNKKVQKVQQNPTFKSLAPYLQSVDDKTSIANNLTNSSHKKIQGKKSMMGKTLSSTDSSGNLFKKS